MLGAGSALMGCMLGRLVRAQEQTPVHRPVTRADLDRIWQQTFVREGRFACTQTQEGTERPFYYPSSLRRRDITEGKPGLPLRLEINVGGVIEGAPQGSECRALPEAIVDVWQADAQGSYSNVGPDIQTHDTTGHTFLRGHYVTDEHGRVVFDTIVPGWELGGAGTPISANRVPPHIHIKVFHGHKVVTMDGKLPADLIDRIYAEVEPYRSHQKMTAPGLAGSYERPGNRASDVLFEIAQDGRGLVAKAVIGLAESMAVGAAPLFR